MRRAAKVDANHADVSAMFRKLGCQVTDTSRLGKGFPDLMVLCRRRVRLVEVKDGRRPPSERKLTPDQMAFHLVWPVEIVYDTGDVQELVNWWNSIEGRSSAKTLLEERRIRGKAQA